MSTAHNGDIVTVHYIGTLENQQVFDSSHDREPLQFTLGEGQVISGFEEAIIGMQPGETRIANITADQAYGPYHPDAVVQVERTIFHPDAEITVGQRLRLQLQDGSALDVTVTELTATHVTLDTNHPLAGQDLTFEIQLLAIQRGSV